MLNAERKRIRIIQVAEAWGGMEYNNTQLAARLVRRGHTVCVTTLGISAYSLMPEHYRGLFEVEEIPWPLDNAPTFWQWYRLMRSRPADIVVLPKNWWTKGGISMIWAARLAYPRVVTREHVPAYIVSRPDWRKRYLRVLPAPHVWWWQHILYGRMLALAPDLTICVSQTVRDRLVTDCGYSAAKTVVAFNGIDTHRFRADMDARQRLRRGLGIPDSATVFGAVGRLDCRTKRHDLSLAEFARLRHERPDADLWFLLVGDGPDRDAIRDLACVYGVTDRFLLAPFTSEPWEAFNAIDVFLMPSAFEGFGLALAEAMACERCVVCMSVGGMGEILNEPDIGFAVPPDDASAFAASMRGALDLGPEGRRKMGARARESIVRRFDADEQYEKIMAYVLG